jgi:hypothetical protein
MKYLVLISFVFSSLSLQAQEQKTGFFNIKKDSSGFELTQAGASFLAQMPMKCISKEFPNKTAHVSNNQDDHVLLPSQLHPAFYGCFDWHSSVHGHWMLVRLLKEFPGLPEADAIKKAIHQNLNEGNINEEIKYFELPNTASWERTYGWAWLLKLDEELSTWDDPDAQEWKRALEPLTQKIISLWLNFLPKQTYAIRTGLHANTAFGLNMAYDYAKTAQNDELKNAVNRSAKLLFSKDVNAPVSWEPSGTDFLSPSLEEARLMQKILSPDDFKKWLNGFYTLNDIRKLSEIPVVSDRSDLQIVHLDGLALSRSWGMAGLAAALPANDPRKKMLMRSGIQHLSAALPHVTSGEYSGEHWLASFAVYALLGSQIQ